MGPVPKEILQPIKAVDNELHQGVKPQLVKMGHTEDTKPASQQPFPLTEEIKQLGVDARHIADSAFHDVVTGASEEARVRGTDSKNVISIMKGRLLHKKAA